MTNITIRTEGRRFQRTISNEAFSFFREAGCITGHSFNTDNFNPNREEFQNTNGSIREALDTITAITQ